MSPPARTLPSLLARRSEAGRLRVLGAPAAAVAAGAGVAALLVLTRSLPTEHPQRLVLQGVVVGVPIVAGVFARRSPLTRRFGTALVVVGLVWALALLGESPYSVPYSAGRVVAWLLPPVLVYLMLIFPRGSLAPGRERTLFGGIVVVVALLFAGSALFVEAYPASTPWATCGTDCPPNAFLVPPEEPAVMERVVKPLRETLAVLLLCGVTVVLVQRVRSASALGRRTVAPVALAGVASTLALAAFLTSRRAVPDAGALDALGFLWGLSIALVAAAFLMGLVRRRLLIADVLARLSLRLGETTDPAGLRPALASAVGDETLDVRLGSASRHGWVSRDGRRSGGPPVAAGRATLEIDDAGSPVALLEFDEALCADDELLDAVASQTRAALQRMRVTTQLESSLEELERSRSRIAAAASQERARIERDLHDGAQQRLIALRIRLSIAEELLGTDPGAALAKVRELGPEIDRALDEMRALAHGIYPSALTDLGLEAALRSVVREAPLPAHLRAEGVTRHPAAIESALYFTCVEALQNAAKHARGGVWILLREDDVLRLEVRDDGAGFDVRAAELAGGLRTMADRVEAVGGHLTVDSAPGRGTRVVATVALDQ